MSQTLSSLEGTYAPSLTLRAALAERAGRGSTQSSQLLVSLFAEGQLDPVTYLNNKALEGSSICMLCSSFQIYNSE